MAESMLFYLPPTRSPASHSGAVYFAVEIIELMPVCQPQLACGCLRQREGLMRSFVIALCITSTPLLAQSTAQKPAFEVASIKPNESGDLRTTSARPLPASGTYTATNQS